MDLASAKRLHWALAASLAAHALLLLFVPNLRPAVSRTLPTKPMRVVRVYQASVIPPQLVSAPLPAVSARTARPVSPPRRKSPPPARTSTPAASTARPAPAAEPSPRSADPPSPPATPSTPIRLGPPESLTLQPPASLQDTIPGFMLAEPAPLPGEMGGTGGDSGQGTDPAASDTGGDSGAASSTGGGDGAGAGAGGAGEGPGGGGDEPTVSPSALSLAKPSYPEQCRRRSQEGTVRLRVLVLRDGSVGTTEVIRSSGIPAFDRAALQGARNWRFRPARRADTPVQAWVTLSVVFRLEDAHG